MRPGPTIVDTVESLKPALRDHVRAWFPDHVPEGAFVHSGVMATCRPILRRTSQRSWSRPIGPTAADIIKAASALDDEGLRTFLELFAQRVRESAVPITHAELKGFLLVSKRPRPYAGSDFISFEVRSE
jgi:hypothetical protein